MLTEDEEKFIRLTEHDRVKITWDSSSLFEYRSAVIELLLIIIKLLREK